MSKICDLILILMVPETNIDWVYFSKQLSCSLVKCHTHNGRQTEQLFFIKGNEGVMNMECNVRSWTGYWNIFSYENYGGNWQNIIEAYKLDCSTILKLISWFSSLHSNVLILWQKYLVFRGKGTHAYNLL